MIVEMKKQWIIWGAICVIASILVGCHTQVKTTQTEKRQEAKKGKKGEQTQIATLDMEQEKQILSDKLEELSGPLFLALFAKDTEGLYTEGTFPLNTDIFGDEKIRQLFIGEVLKSDRDYDSKWVVGTAEELALEEPEAMAYDVFNGVYKAYFGKDFDINQATPFFSKTNLDDKGYVFYINVRHGLNGVGNEFIAEDISFDETTKVYTAQLSIQYIKLEQISEQLKPTGKAELCYKKDAGGNITIVSYVITD